MLKSLMIVGCGSFVGGALRYLLTRTVQNWFDGWMPAGTLAVNVLGCLLIGLFCGLSQEWMPQSLKLFLTVGFCGGFVPIRDMEPYTCELCGMQMLRISDAAGVCLNVVVSLVAGFVALYAGYQAARLF